MAKVRSAREADFPEILAMAAALHQESPRFRGVNFTEEKVYNLGASILSGARPGGVLVAEVDGIIVGMLAFVVAEHFFGTDKYATEICAYVKPERRGGRAFFSLIKGFEKAAREYGVVEIVTGSATEINTARTASALERMGFKRFAVGLMKECR